MYMETQDNINIKEIMQICIKTAVEIETKIKRTKRFFYIFLLKIVLRTVLIE